MAVFQFFVTALHRSFAQGGGTGDMQDACFFCVLHLYFVTLLFGIIGVGCFLKGFYTKHKTCTFLGLFYLCVSGAVSLSLNVIGGRHGVTFDIPINSDFTGEVFDSLTTFMYCMSAAVFVLGFVLKSIGNRILNKY